MGQDNQGWDNEYEARSRRIHAFERLLGRLSGDISNNHCGAGISLPESLFLGDVYCQNRTLRQSI